jgi:3-hydroxyacyl-[acyl-carrier-protein] dehydratase
MKSGNIQIHIQEDHPAFAGHFPDMPIVPGVVLLDEALQAVGIRLNLELSACQINAMKFLHPVRPGDPVHVQYESQDSGLIRIDLFSGDKKVATGSFQPHGVT